jgi:hypothetical protein
VKARDKNVRPVVIDACVLINLAVVDRLPILENIPGARFLVKTLLAMGASDQDLANVIAARA